MIGIDIEDISRFKGKKKSFYERIFTVNEIKYCMSKNNPEQHFAARFCAKEAVYKALSTAGFKSPVISNIEIITGKNSIPEVRLINSDIKQKIYISLSHEKEKAIAIALLSLNKLEKYSYLPCFMGDEG